MHVDLVGPLPLSRGYSYCLTMIDRFTRWIKACPLPDITADTVARAFYMHWIARFGIPRILTSDQGRQFESHLFASLVKSLGIKHIRTTAYHSSSNGLIENWHRTMKAALKAHLTDRWTEVLPTVLLGMRLTFRDTIKATTAELVYGTSLKLPGEFLAPIPMDFNAADFVQQLQEAMKKLCPAPTTNHNTKSRTFVSMDLKQCKQVFVRHDAVQPPLKPPYDGPFIVFERSDNVYKVQIGDKPKYVSIDCLKPAYTLKIPETECATNNLDPKSDVDKAKAECPGDEAKHTRSGHRERFQ